MHASVDRHRLDGRCRWLRRRGAASVNAGVGPTPTLPAPTSSLLPTVNVVTAKGWPPGTTPIAAPGTVVTAFASGLNHPRWLYVLPNGDVLVAETNAPVRPDDNKGIKGWFFKRFQAKAGGAVPTANRITLLRDADGDGIAETRLVLLGGLTSPFGIALAVNTLYVANTDAVVRFPYVQGQTQIVAAATKVVDLPAERSITIGRRMSWRVRMAPGSTSASARTATSRRTASITKRDARRSVRP